MSLLQIHEPGQTPEPHAEGVKPAVGIDLGTTHSVVAFSHDQQVIVFSDDDGQTLMPSIVARDAAGWHVGHTALPHPDRVSSIKRLMGRGLSDLVKKNEALPVSLIDRGDDAIRFEMASEAVTPVQLSALILQQMRALAEAGLECEIEQAVITVPAYFDDAARTATRDAARLAGLQVLRLINEPTAAALAYGLDAAEDGIFAVYDLGGGTFDLSILKLEQGVFQVLATAGDTQLGGDDIDRALAAHLAKENETFATLSLVNQLSLARRMKQQLSEDETANIDRVMATRATLESLAEPLIQLSLNLCDVALRDAGIEKQQIQQMVLVGGSTRMPLVRQCVEAWYGRPPLATIDPDEVVAVGAAIQAEALTRGASHLLLDVTPLSLGLETMGGVVEKIIHRNSPIPLSISREFTTSQDGQTAMKIHVLQGERELVGDCRSLANFALTNIPPMPANMARIKVTFTVDADGLLSVSAQETTTGAMQRIEVKPTYGLPMEEMEAMLRAAMNHAQDDIFKRLLIESRVEAERLIHDINHAMAVDGDLLSPTEKTSLEQGITLLQETLGGDVRELIDARAQQLGELSNPFAARRMDKAIASALEGRHIKEYDDAEEV